MIEENDDQDPNLEDELSPSTGPAQEVEGDKIMEDGPQIVQIIGD